MTTGLLSDTWDNLSDCLRNFESDIYYLKYQLEFLLTTLFLGVAKQHPGSTSSKLTGEEKVALTLRDVLKKLYFQLISGIVFRTLKYKTQFSS